MKPGALRVRLQIHYLLLFAPFAIATTYQNLHFKRCGFTESEIGTLNALAALLAVLSPPLWGMVTDRAGDKRIPLALLFLASGATYPLFLLADSLGSALLIQAVFNFSFAPCIPLTDAIALELLPRAGGDYGRIRLWGSLGFIVTLLVSGLFLGGGPLAPKGGGDLVATFVAFGIVRVLGAAWVLSLPRGEAPQAVATYRGDLGALFRDRGFLLFLAATFLCNTALRSYYVFLSIYLDGLGVSDSMKGVFWSLGVAAEVVFMVFAWRLVQRMGVCGMLMLGMAGGALRLILFSLFLPVGAVALAQGLHALAFGATHIASLTFINASVPERFRASGQTLHAAIVGGLGGVLGSRLAGDLAQAWGIPAAFRACGLLAGVAALLVVLLPERQTGTGEEKSG
ncbi:MAG TPA: MFS transporter [Armatimonadota bacterium]|nr:MFS transporter [Armatimonadota bacterium]